MSVSLNWMQVESSHSPVSQGLLISWLSCVSRSTHSPGLPVWSDMLRLNLTLKIYLDLELTVSNCELE